MHTALEQNSINIFQICLEIPIKCPYQSINRAEMPLAMNFFTLLMYYFKSWIFFIFCQKEPKLMWFITWSYLKEHHIIHCVMNLLMQRQ